MGRINQTRGAQKLGLGVLVIFVVVLVIGVVANFPSASNVGYAPEQPIKFSHRVHSGDNKIDCMYCHTGPEKSRHSTVPAMNVCMNCHSVVKTDSPEIKKLTEAYKAGKPIEWVRIHELPDFVYFPHKRHIAKGLACETCHGDVKGMDKVYQYSDLTMGWCLDCHRGKTTPRSVLKQVETARLNEGEFENTHGFKPGQVATTACSACHF